MIIELVKIEIKQCKFIADVKYKKNTFHAVDRTPEGVIKKCQELIQMIHRMRKRR